MKVFNDLFEIYKLYHGDLSKNTFHKLIQYEGYKFYLIEIHIANSIQKKISEFECGIGICVRGTNILINRTVQYKNVSPIIEIVPVEETIVDCIVETYLILQFNNSLIKLDLQTVVLDISYHFHTFLENSKSNNLNKKILQINKHYNQSDIDQLRRPILTENVFHSQITSEELIKLFLNHSYHLLDIDLFSEFTNNDLNTFSVYFSTGYNKHLLTFDPKNKKIIISCNIDDMLILKSHFIKGCLKGIAANKKTEGEIQVCNFIEFNEIEHIFFTFYFRVCLKNWQIL